MYNVLIADDSAQLRNGLKCLIDWNQTGFRVSGEAANGKEALILLGREPFHVLLTDIQMPGMDGLELIKQCAQDHPNLETIIISGYDEFAYARTAIQFGAADYLLKPIVRSELIRVLDKIRLKLEAQARDKTERSFLRWKLNQSVSALREQFLLQLVNGSVNEGVSVQERVSQLQLGGVLRDRNPVQFIGAEMRVPPGRLDGAHQRPDLMRLAFQMMCRDIAHMHEGRMAAFHDYNFANMMFFIVRLDGSDDSYIRTAAEEIEHSLNHYLRIEVKLGIGRPCLPYAGLKTGYASCLFSWSRGGADRGEAADKQAAPAQPQAADTALDELERRMTLALEKEDGAAFAEHFLSLFSEGETANPMEDSIRIMRVILLLNSVCRKYNNNAAKLYDYTWMCYFAVWKFESREHISGQVARLAAYVIENVHESRKSGTAAVVEAIRDYIDRNYAYELSLSVFAEDYHFNETYLSKMFKKQIGKTFSEYILEVRMAQAVQLLRHSDLNLDDIAGLIGFSNASYFSNVFKKHYGCGPRAYRIRMQESRSPQG